jgi:hypothetical protein
VWLCVAGTNRVLFAHAAAVSRESVAQQLGLRGDAIALQYDGCALSDAECVRDPQRFAGGVLQVKLRGGLCGGKGGFGSLLRSKKSVVKTTNFGACRDLNGRRLRHVEQERALADWQAQAPQRELEKARAALEAKDVSSSAVGAAHSADPTFAAETTAFCDSVGEAVRKRMRAAHDEDDDDDDDLFNDGDGDDDVAAAGSSAADDARTKKQKSSDTASTATTSAVTAASSSTTSSSAPKKAAAKKTKKLFDDDEFGSE